jgi:hypothetical protein
MDMIEYPGLLKYRRWRYLKANGVLVALALAAYALENPAGGETYGGTWLGYTLGILSAILVLVLFWYGITKRMPPRKIDQRQHLRIDRRKLEQEGQKILYKRRGIDRRKIDARETWRYGGTMQGWLSAHCYIGGTLIVIASLHSGFNFAWNVHTLAYVLMMTVVASGLYGIYVYLNYPRMITLNMGKDSMEGLLSKIAELDEMARVRALGLPDDINQLVLRARLQTRLGGSLLQMLFAGTHHNCPTRAATLQLLELGQKYIHDEQPKLLRDLYVVLLRKDKLLGRVRREVMLKARLQFWLYFHAPLAVALIAAIVAHVVSILFYW